MALRKTKKPSKKKTKPKSKAKKTFVIEARGTGPLKEYAVSPNREERDWLKSIDQTLKAEWSNDDDDKL